MALPQFKDVDFQIDWLPFFLGSPLDTDKGVPIVEHLAQKYGAQRARQIEGALRDSAAKIGLTFNDKRTTLNTLLSHRLVEFAKRKGKHVEIVERMFEAYFALARDISDIEVLVGLAAAEGLNAAETRQFLKSDELAREVIEEAQQLQARFRVTGVPLFLISRPESNPIHSGSQGGQVHKLNGAQDSAAFATLFEHVLEEQ